LTIQASQVSDAKKAAQKEVDGAILKSIDSMMKAYLNARFSLTNKDRPHEMIF